MSFIFIGVIIPEFIRNLYIFITLLFFVSVLSLFELFDGAVLIKPMRYILYLSSLGVVYLIASIVTGGWTENYQHNLSFALRQSYFVFLLPIFTYAGVSIYKTFSENSSKFILNKVFYILSFILIMDIILSVILGDPDFLINNGYTFYLDKGLIWFFVCFLYYYGLFYSERGSRFFYLVTIIFLMEILLGYGVMFNAMTGFLLYLIMLISFIFVKFKLNTYLLVLSLFMIVFSLFFMVCVFPFYSELFYSDLNTYWRYFSWRNNYEAVMSNYGFGVGFGVAYFPNVPEALDAAFKSAINSGLQGSGGLYDSLFIRGQHSSIVNIIFRLGVLGFIFLIGFVFSLFNCVSSARNNKSVLFLLPFFVSGFLNVSVHVGFESPPFLMTISISIGLLIAAINKNLTRDIYVQK
jgi:hypothetical protein